MQDDEAVGRLPRGRKPVKRKPTETLRVACGLQRRAAAVGFDWPDARGPRAKVEEELKELDRETRKGKRETWEEEVGDLLFAVVNLARTPAINPRASLDTANDKFKRRLAEPQRPPASGGDTGR